MYYPQYTPSWSPSLFGQEFIGPQEQYNDFTGRIIYVVPSYAFGYQYEYEYFDDKGFSHFLNSKNFTFFKI